MYQSGDVLAHFKGFLEVAAQHTTREKEEVIYCPCNVCKNNVMYLYKDHKIIYEHLVQSGFMNNYFIWSKHGETQARTESIIDEKEEENMNADHVYSHHDDEGEDDVGENDECLDVEELMQNVAPHMLLQCRNKGFDNFETLDKASRDLLYEECKGCHKEHMLLWMTLELLKLKASNWWSCSSFLALLALLSKVLPKPNGLPTRTYIAKNIICPLTLGVEIKSMLARTIASYTEKNMNSNISIEGAMLVGTNGMTEVRKIPTIIRGKVRRGRTPLLKIKSVKGLKREKFLPV
jgi:hypothetical protein